MPDGVIAWDTCVLIDAIQKSGGRWGAIAPMVNLGNQGHLKIILSTLSVAEGYFLREMAEAGKLPGRKLGFGPGAVWRFSRAALVAWLSGPEKPDRSEKR